jgi:penicillin-binding protein 1C
VAIDRASGLRATADTPPERVVERVYAILPPEAQAWAQEQGIPQPPPNTEAMSRIALAGTADQVRALVMTSPDAGAVYRLDPALPRDAQRILIAAHQGFGHALGQVTLLVDGRPLAEFGAPPYQTWWQLEPGAHLLSAEGLDASGQPVHSSGVWIQVQQ